MSACLADIASRIITVSTGFNIAVTAGASIAVTFGMLTNPITQKSPGTLTIQSYTDSTFKYYID